MTSALHCTGQLETIKPDDQKSSVIFDQKCSRCHDLKRVFTLKRDENVWRETVTAMCQKKDSDCEDEVDIIVRRHMQRQQKEAGIKISEEELNILTRYHISYEKTIADLSMRKCARCHGRERVLTRTGLLVTWEQLIMEMSQKEGSHIIPDDIEKLVQYHVAKQKIEQETFEKDCSTCHEPEETLMLHKQHGKRS